MNIALQNFESSGSNYNFINTNGSLQAGNSSSSDRPASAPFYVSSNTGFRATNQTATLTFDNIKGLSTYISKKLTIRLSAFSINSPSNGMDAADKVAISISLNGGSSYSDELLIKGNSNAYWHYTTGTGIASVNYDGNNSPLEFSPAGGGNRTTDGYSTLIVNLPDSCTQLKLKIGMTDDSNNEAWLIDDVLLTGCMPPSFINCPANSMINTNNDLCTTLFTYIVTAIGIPNPTVTYLFSGATTASGSGTGSPGLFNIGVTTVKITAVSTCGPAAVCQFNVKVEDHQYPIIVCPSNQIRTEVDPCIYKANGTEFDPISSSDNCNGLINSYLLSDATTGSGLNTLAGINFNPGQTTIKWIATDGSGNSSTCNFSLAINLFVISCPADTTICISSGLLTLSGGSPVNGIYSGPGVSAGKFDPVVAGAGVHAITYTFTDANACSNECTFQISVLASPIHNLQTNIDYCSLQEAITAAENSNTNELQIPAGTYLGSCIEIAKNIKLTSLTSGIQIPCLKMSAIGKFLILGGDIKINQLTLTFGKIRTNGNKLSCGSISGGSAVSYIVAD